MDSTAVSWLSSPVLITAITSIVGALVTIFGLVFSRKLGKQDESMIVQDEKLDKIHVLVDGRLGETLAKVDTQAASIVALHGIISAMAEKMPVASVKKVLKGK